MAEATSSSSRSPGAASVGLRLLALIGALALAFGCAVLVLVVIELIDNPLCSDTSGVAAALLADGAEASCFDGSSVTRILAIVFGAPAALLAGLAALMALGFALGMRIGKRLLMVIAAAVVLAGAMFLVGEI